MKLNKLMAGLMLCGALLSSATWGTASANNARRPMAINTSLGQLDLVKDIYSGASTSSISFAVEIGGRLLFTATDSTNGSELWITDGTTNGTTLVKDIYTGINPSSPSNFVVFDNYAIFIANDPTYGTEPWITNGTPNGTTLLKDIYPGNNGMYPNSGNPTSLVKFGNKALFQAYDSTNGWEAWVTNGTPNGTTLLKDIYPGNNGSNAQDFSVLGDKVLFRASDATNGTELWITDGTPEGTTLLKDIDPSSVDYGMGYIYPNSSSPSNFMKFGQRMLFQASDPTNGTELWITDGTTIGTTLVKDIAAGSSGSSPSSFVIFGNKAIFVAYSSATGYEPWITDGTTIGTYALGDLNPGSSSSLSPNYYYYSAPSPLFYPSGDRVLFSANNSASGTELWSTDGSVLGTAMVNDLRSGSSSGVSPICSMMCYFTTGPEIYVLNGRTLFKGDDGTTGYELWSMTPLPSAPRSPTVSATPTTATVSWLAPAVIGQFPITAYTVTSNPGNFTCTTSTLSCTVSGLLSNQDYTFTVFATTIVGSSPSSVASSRIRTPSPQLGSLIANLTTVSNIVADSSFVPGQSVTVLYSGFNPSELVLMLMASNPVVIGSANADANGGVAITGTIPSQAVAGAHTLALYAPVSGFGAAQAITINTPAAAAQESSQPTIETPIVSPELLPATGNGTNIFVFANVLFLVGVALTTGRRLLRWNIKTQQRS